MKKIVAFMHVSLDGFVAGPNGEMDWIKADEDMFELAGRQTEDSDTALYGRVTYEMMQAYWPTAAEQQNASKHDIEHSYWYNHVQKVVLSTTLDTTGLSNTRAISTNIYDEISALKAGEGKDIVIFGSPSVCHTLMKNEMIDEYRLFINPVLLGQGIPMFSGISKKQVLSLVSQTTFKSGVTCLHYQAG